MKKLIAVLALAASTTAGASGWASFDVDSVSGRSGAKDSTAQYLRVGKSFGDVNLMVQGRTARFDGGGLVNSVETTVSTRKVSLGPITPFVGFGYDNGFNGGPDFNYGLVGATVGQPVGPGFAMAGVKTRVGSTQDNMTHQTVAFASYSVPVTKHLGVNFNVSRSSQDIKENAVGLGLGVKF
jgi:hypothetical protein